MKKLMVFLLIGCLALMLGGSIFAAELPGLPSPGGTDYTGKIDDGNASTASAKVTATLRAYIAPYAHLWFDAPYYIKGNVGSDTRLNFTGQANETKYGFVRYNLETNCDVNVDGFGTAFVGNTFKDDILDTWFNLYPVNDNANANVDDPLPTPPDWRQVINGYVWAPEAYDHKYIKGTAGNPGVGHYRVDFKATTGPEISSQRAGGYTATYTITVWSPTNFNAEI